MLKTGIFKLEQLNELNNLKSIFGADKRVSITLYDQIFDYSNAEALAERILLMFTDERGAYKRTYSQRFAEFDTLCARVLAENFDQENALTVHDVAVSDGR